MAWYEGARLECGVDGIKQERDHAEQLGGKHRSGVAQLGLVRTASLSGQAQRLRAAVCVVKRHACQCQDDDDLCRHRPVRV